MDSRLAKYMPVAIRLNETGTLSAISAQASINPCILSNLYIQVVWSLRVPSINRCRMTVELSCNKNCPMPSSTFPDRDGWRSFKNILCEVGNVPVILSSTSCGRAGAIGDTDMSHS
jgi:hypothetical protein